MKKNKLLYLEEKEFIAKAYYCDKVEEIYSIRSEINRLANTHLFNILEYRKLIKKVVDLKNKIPIYFSNSLFMFYLRNNEGIYWINYFNILKICYENEIIIIFQNGDILKLDISKKIIIKELNKIDMILGYIKNLYQ